MSATTFIKAGAWALAAAMLAGCATGPGEPSFGSAAHRQKLETPVDEMVTEPPFDEAKVQHGLGRGNATIQGFLHHRLIPYGEYAGTDSALVNLEKVESVPVHDVELWLVPASDHLEAWLRLVKQNRSARKGRFRDFVQTKNYMPDQRAWLNARKTRSDAQGRFQFPQLRPGRYLLLSQRVTIASQGHRRQYLGSSYQTSGGIVGRHGYTPIGGTVHYSQLQPVRVGTEVEHMDFVDVPPGQGVVELKARMRPL